MDGNDVKEVQKIKAISTIDPGYIDSGRPAVIVDETGAYAGVVRTSKDVKRMLLESNEKGYRSFFG